MRLCTCVLLCVFPTCIYVRQATSCSIVYVTLLCHLIFPVSRCDFSSMSPCLFLMPGGHTWRLRNREQTDARKSTLRNTRRSRQAGRHNGSGRRCHETSVMRQKTMPPSLLLCTLTLLCTIRSDAGSACMNALSTLVLFCYYFITHWWFHEHSTVYHITWISGEKFYS